MSLQNILVYIVIFAAVLYVIVAVRRIFRKINSPGCDTDGCSGGGCDGCSGCDG